MMSGKQVPPQRDNRKRAFISRKIGCYLMAFRGNNTLDFSQSIYRKVYSWRSRSAVEHNGLPRIIYSPKLMIEIVNHHLENGGIVNVGGKLLYSVKDTFDPYPFISIMSANDLACHPKHQEILLKPDHFDDYEI